MDREDFLRLLSRQPASEAEPTEYLRNPDDETWHIVWDAADDGKLVAPCGLALFEATTDPPASAIECPPCAEHVGLCKEIVEREQRHFLDVEERTPILIREREHTWIAADFTDISNGAMGLLFRESVRLNAHVYAVPGGSWEFVPLEAEPDLTDRMMLDERAWQEIH